MTIPLDQSIRRQQLIEIANTRPLTLEESKEAVAILRQGRTHAQTASTVSKKAKAESKAQINTSDLLKKLKGLQT